MITKEQLKRIAIYATPANIETFYPLLCKYMPMYGIVSRMRIISFLAQIIHESGSFKYTKELASGKAYDTGRLAAKLGNTPEADGDGQKYKGRGLIQITGTANYRLASKALGVDLLAYPEKLETPDLAVKSACWWWKEHGLNELADRCEFKAITRKINGGYNGYEDRLRWYNKGLEVIK